MKKKQTFCLISKIKTKCITIFERLLDINPGVISAHVCNSTTDNLNNEDFLVFIDIHYSGNYLHENTEHQPQIYIQSAYL